MPTYGIALCPIRKSYEESRIKLNPLPEAIERAFDKYLDILKFITLIYTHAGSLPFVAKNFVEPIQIVAIVFRLNFLN
jgi:hypothetical protein